MPVRGVDSLVGRWESNDARLSFDFGRPASVVFGPDATPVQVAGNPGQMSRSERSTPEGFTRVVTVGVPNGPGGRFLRMTFYFKEQVDQELVRTILGSVEY